MQCIKLRANQGIEHRLFPHVTRALQGVILESVELVKTLVERTTTKKGLKVVVHIIDKVYQIGKKLSKKEKEKIKSLTIHDEFLGHWNYKVLPAVNQFNKLFIFHS